MEGGVHDRWGKYELEALLARGGMAEVYRASRIDPSGARRTVCLKMVRPEHGDDAEFSAMFRREARIAASLAHPNIVQVFDFDSHDGRLFLAMEYVDGLDLRDVLRQADDLGLRVPPGFALHVAEGLLSALLCAHEHTVDGVLRPVVHRDVSPHNLLVSREGLVKLADFGIAKTRGGTSATRTGVVKGKLAYLSPEQAAGGDVGPASDLFCAGLVLFEMLAGRRLHVGRNEQEVLALALRPSVPELPWLSPALNGFLARLLAPALETRIGSAERALAELAPLRIHAPCGPADAGALVKALLELRSVGGSTGLLTPSSRVRGAGRSRSGPGGEVPAGRPLADGPTRASQPPSAPRRGLKPAPALGIAAAVLCAGLGAGWLIGAGADPKPAAPPSDPLVAPLQAAAPVADAILVDGPDSGARAEAAAEPIAPLPAAVEKASKSGWLQINCRPWAEVALDGEPIGTTPINRLRVSAGAHEVILSNPAAGYRERFDVKVAPGRTAHVNGKLPGT
jgi:serine/threonine-protein kinase